MFGRSACWFANFVLLIATGLVFSGCPSTPVNNSQVTSLEPIRPTIAPAAPAPAAAAPAVESAPQIVSVAQPVEPAPQPKERQEPVLPEEKLQLPPGKLPLSAWAQLCGFSQVRPVANSNPPVFDLLSSRGNLTLVVGQRYAKWNGTTIGLGFAPTTERGHVVAHSIDVSKNFYPLGLGTFSVPRKERVLVIDPGHGGADPGTRATTRKAFEKDFALDWALRIERLLANSSWRVVLTRRDDRDIPLMDRVAVSDANQADLFISLHFNSIESNDRRAPEETGIETYCLTPVGAPSNVTRNFEDDVRRVYPNNEFDAQNVLFACRMQSSLVGTTGRRDRGVRRARFMTVVREQKRPAILIEGGFLSNPVEVAQIMLPSYREQMARAVVNGLPN